MLGYRPIATAALATIDVDIVQPVTQEITMRYASESFVTRSTDSPAHTFIPGRISRGLTIGRRIADGDDGTIGSLIESRFGEVELNNSDGALDTLANDFFADGRQIRLKIGAREVIGASRIVPQFIRTGTGTSSSNASAPYEIFYPSTALFEETWAGTSGDPWPSARWQEADVQDLGSPTSVVDLQSNTGRLVAQSGSQTRARIISLSGVIANFNLTAEVTLATGDQTANNEFHNLNFRASGGWSTANEQDRLNGYSLEFRTASGSQTFQLVSVVNSARATLGSVAKSFGTSSWGVRIQADGTALKAKAWQGLSEPASWDIEVTDSSHSQGDFSFATVNGTDGGARTANWDNLLITELTSDGIVENDFLIAQLTINDRGGGGELSSVPAGWTLLDESTAGSPAVLYQALLYRFADGTEAGDSVSFNWTSADSSNDCIVGRIHQFRYVDLSSPITGLTAATIGDTSSIDLPTVTTVLPNSLATYWVSWSDNVSTTSPAGETGGDWTNIGDNISTGAGDDAGNRRAGAIMIEPGTISGGSITTTPSSPVSDLSLVVGLVLQGVMSDTRRERVQSFSSFVLVYTAIAGEWTLERDILRLRIKDLSTLLQDRLQSEAYGGTGGENGGTDLTGRSRPRAFGRCLNVTAQLVDAAALIYQLNSGTIQQILAIYDQGIEVPGSSPSEDFVTYGDLVAATVTPGSYVTCLNEGYFRLGTTPTGTVTADLLGDASPDYVNTHAGIIKRMVSTALSPVQLDEPSFEDMDDDQPAEIGIFFPAGDQSTVEEAVARVARSANAFAGQDRSGIYRVQLLEVPVAGSAIHWSFDDRDIITIERVALPYRVPWKAWGVGFNKNWTVQASSELAAGVTQERRQFLESEYRYSFQTNTAIALAHRTSVGGFRDSLFVDEEDAADEAERLLTFYGLGRAMYLVTVKNVLFSVEVGQTVLLTYNRWNLTQGRRHIVVAVADDADQVSTEMLVFG